MRRRLPPELVTVVALGSGSVVAVCKEACRLHAATGAPPPVLVLVPIANSVTAFASSLAVLLKDGVKRSFPGRFPDAVLCDTETLAGAPAALTRAGLADCCARFIAYGDWSLAHRLGFTDRYSETPLHLMGADLDRLYLAHAAEMGAATPAGTELLAKQLLLAGLAQSIVNVSTPLSGTEHVVSHLLEMGAPVWGRPTALHGAQVGVATLVAAAAYEALLALPELPAIPAADDGRLEPAALRARVLAALTPLDPSGALAAECWRDYAAKLRRWREPEVQARYAELRRDWPAVVAELRRLVRPASVVRRILAAAGCPLRFEALDPPIPPAQYRFALLNAHFIRARFTVGDLLFWLGRWDERLVDHLLRTALPAG